MRGPVRRGADGGVLAVQRPGVKKLPLTSVLLLGSNFFGTYKVDPFAQEPYKAPYGINAGKASHK